VRPAYFVADALAASGALAGFSGEAAFGVDANNQVIAVRNQAYGIGYRRSQRNRNSQRLNLGDFHETSNVARRSVRS
jgi:hypothetical protein